MIFLFLNVTKVFVKKGKDRMSIKTVHLVLIDPQHDFCHPTGNLYVDGAEDDMSRVGEMIRRLGKKLYDIHVTLDQHHMMDVAHPCMWRGTNGAPPPPYTIISNQDVVNGIWSPTIPSLQRRMIEYTRALNDDGRYPLCIWPPHCLIGSPGAVIVPSVLEPLNEWAINEGCTVDYVSKGSNIYTEHYGAVKAEYPDPQDPSTQLNASLISTIEEADMILIAGEAGSHCLANTVIDIADNFSDPEFIKKMILLTDGTSPVTGFEQLQEDFINKMTAKGMTLSTTTDILK
jgi:nicotinamidase-related amidase